MNPLVEWRLSKEDKNIRRLVWILQMKKSCKMASRTKRWLDIKKDKQIIILKGEGYDYKVLCNMTKTYDCIWEMLE